jgi:hypothetical protein
MVLLITQNTCVKNINIPQKAKFFLKSFMRLKSLFTCIWKLEKLRYLCEKKSKKYLSAYEKKKKLLL